MATTTPLSLNKQTSHQPRERGTPHHIISSNDYTVYLYRKNRVVGGPEFNDGRDTNKHTSTLKAGCHSRHGYIMSLVRWVENLLDDGYIRPRCECHTEDMVMSGMLVEAALSSVYHIPYNTVDHAPT